MKYRQYISIILQTFYQKNTIQPQKAEFSFSTFYGKKSRVKRTILHSNCTLLKSCRIFVISLRSMINLADDFKSPLLDTEITNISLETGQTMKINIIKISNRPKH